MKSRHHSRKGNRTRKHKRGSGLIFRKTDDENIENCKNYWSDPKNIGTEYYFSNKDDCEYLSKVYDYPGLARQLVGDKVTHKKDYSLKYILEYVNDKPRLRHLKAQ